MTNLIMYVIKIYVFHRRVKEIGFFANIIHAKKENTKLSTKAEIAMEIIERNAINFP